MGEGIAVEGKTEVAYLGQPTVEAVATNVESYCVDIGRHARGPMRIVEFDVPADTRTVHAWVSERGPYGSQGSGYSQKIVFTRSVQLKPESREVSRCRICFDVASADDRSYALVAMVVRGY